jgi:hypothetical protein
MRKDYPVKTRRVTGSRVILDQSSVSSVPLCFKEILGNLEVASKIKNTEAQRAQSSGDPRSKLRVLSATVFQRNPEEPGSAFEDKKHRGTKGTK